MKYRIRLTLIFLLVGLLPLAAGSAYILPSVRQLGETFSAASTRDIQAIMEREVVSRVEGISQQIIGYAILHPDVSLVDRFSLRANQDLALLAVPPLGSESFVSIYNAESVIIYHTNADMIGVNQFLSDAHSNPAQWDLIFKSLTSQTMVDGYYDATVDGAGHRMYMAARQAGNNIPIIVSVTVDADQYMAAYGKTTLEMEDRAHRNAVALSVTLGGLSVMVVMAAIFFSGRLAHPVQWMARTADQLLHYVESITPEYHVPSFRDEIALLSHTIGLLTTQLREQVAKLETMVASRTAELAQRTAQLETAAQLARESAAILDVDELLKQTTSLISERFAFYHTGIFLVDQAGEYVVLQASNSDGGKRMLARGHKLKVGQGVVGYVVAKKEPRIVSEVGEDAVHFKNPDLPYTRSEMALPLKVRERVIGALDVQSTHPSAFSDEDMRILQILADQLALAIENARLFDQSQRALRELELAYGQQTREAWQRRLSGKPIAFAYNRLGVDRLESPAELTTASSPTIETVDGAHRLSVPLILRGQLLGSIVMYREAEQTPWLPEELHVVEDAASQLTSILENARLLEEIRQRAHQESLIGQISSKVQTSLDVETVLRIAVREIGHALSAQQVQIKLSPGYRGN